MTEETGILGWLRSMEQAYEAKVAADEDDDVAQALADNYGEAAAEIERLQAALKPILELPRECVESLTHKRQIDEDGCEVGVSHQAVDEIYAALTSARAIRNLEGGGK